MPTPIASRSGGEQGDQERAEFVRVQVELARQCSGHVAHPEFTGEKWHKKVERDCPCCGLQARESNLLSPANVRRWLGGTDCTSCDEYIGTGKIPDDTHLRKPRWLNCPCCSGTGVECEWFGSMHTADENEHAVRPRAISWHRGFALVEMLPGECWDECGRCKGTGFKHWDVALPYPESDDKCPACHGDKYRPAAPLVRLMRTGAVSGVRVAGRSPREYPITDELNCLWVGSTKSDSITANWEWLPLPVFDALDGYARRDELNDIRIDPRLEHKWYASPAAAHEALARAVAGWGAGIGATHAITS